MQSLKTLDHVKNDGIHHIVFDVISGTHTFTRKIQKRLRGWYRTETNITSFGVVWLCLHISNQAKFHYHVIKPFYYNIFKIRVVSFYCRWPKVHLVPVFKSQNNLRAYDTTFLKKTQVINIQIEAHNHWELKMGKGH